MSVLTANFAPTRILVAMNSRSVRCQEASVLHAEDTFYTAFQYSERDLPLPLSSLISEGNDRSTMSALDVAHATGASLDVNMTLTDKFNECVSCQVSVAACCSVTAVGPSLLDYAYSHFTVITIRTTGMLAQNPVPSSAATSGMGEEPEGSVGGLYGVRGEP
jgi:hypothetical protein